MSSARRSGDRKASGPGLLGARAARVSSGGRPGPARRQGRGARSQLFGGGGGASLLARSVESTNALAHASTVLMGTPALMVLTNGSLSIYHACHERHRPYSRPRAGPATGGISLARPY